MNRQGSEGTVDRDTGELLSRREAETQALAREIYEERIELGIAREQARKDLPLSTYTEAYWKIDLHNLLRFLVLRIDEKAQLEIREYATVIGNEIVKKWVPLAWEAFVDYRLDSMQLSGIEIDAVSAIARGEKEVALDKLTASGLLKKDGPNIKTTREGAELTGKLERLGIEVPWKKK
jgi:thymidylate synthase (FAD)